MYINYNITMEFTLVSNNDIYTLQQYDPNYSKDRIENKINLNYFRNLLNSTYAELSNYNACKKCIEEFDNICFTWEFACDIWFTYYDFDFSEIKKLINKPEYLAIFKVHLLFQ